jgi:hypothetical protein
MHDQHSGGARHRGHRGNLPNEIELEVVVKRHVPCVGGRGEKQRIAIRRCSHDRLRGNGATRAGPILDNELLAKTLRQPLSDEARVRVIDTARRKAGNDANRPRRIGLRPRDPRPGGNRDSTCGQMQKISTFHGDPKDFGQGQIRASPGSSNAAPGVLP